MSVIKRTLRKFPNLRYYQKEAIELTAERLRKTKEPLLIILPTGAGKSWVIAGLSAVVKSMAKSDTKKKKKVLVLAPSAELVEQNHGKMIEAGFSASIYSADLKIKDTSGEVIFGSHISVNKSAEAFVEEGLEIAMVVIDESHSFIEKAAETVAILKKSNPNIRVVGLTATPYKMGAGYIYKQNTYMKHEPLSEGYARNPYFSEVTYEKNVIEMIEEGFLIPPIIGETSEYYDVSGLKRISSGGFTKESTDDVFIKGRGDLTKRIIADIKQKTKTRQSVMIFTQSRDHAAQVLKLLPPKTSALIDSMTNKSKDRPEIIKKFKEGKIKYLVNVNTLTKGFDAPSVSAICLLRHTESPALLQQIIGRGMRLSPETGKRNFLILDYAKNIPPDGDILSPQIIASKQGSPREFTYVEIECPSCKKSLEVRAGKSINGTYMNKHGFLFRSEDDTQVITPKGEPVSGHLAVRCSHFNIPEDPKKKPTRCKQTWGKVICTGCEALNPIFTHFCVQCNHPLSKSASMLGSNISLDDQYRHRIAEVKSPWKIAQKISQSGNTTIQVTLTIQELPYIMEYHPDMDEDGRSDIESKENDSKSDSLVEYVMKSPDPIEIMYWLTPGSRQHLAREQWQLFSEYAKANLLPKNEDTEGADLPPVLKEEHGDSFIVSSPKKIVFANLPKPTPNSRQFFEIIDYNYRQKRK